MKQTRPEKKEWLLLRLHSSREITSGMNESWSWKLIKFETELCRPALINWFNSGSIWQFLALFHELNQQTEDIQFLIELMKPEINQMARINQAISRRKHQFRKLDWNWMFSDYSRRMNENKNALICCCDCSSTYTGKKEKIRTELRMDWLNE